MNSFQIHMKAMRQHYLDGATHAYALPITATLSKYNSGLMLKSASEPENSSENVKKLTNSFESDIKKYVSDTKVESQKEVESLSKEKGDKKARAAAFKKMMEEKRKKVKEEMNKKVDEQFDKLIDEGTSNPSQQDLILDIANKYNQFMLSIIDSISAFFARLVATIQQWIQDAVKWISDTIDSISNWAENQYKSIQNFFVTLF